MAIDKKLLRKQLAGLKAFNRWEEKHGVDHLKGWSAQRSIDAYLELCQFANEVSPNARQIFEEWREKEYWEWYQKIMRIAPKT